MKTPAANTTSKATPPTTTSEQSANPRSDFAVLFVNMSWKLAIVVLLPVIIGVQVDKAMGDDHSFLFVGLAIALLGSSAVMWGTLQTANKLPVPKVSAAEKRKIQQQYDEDDKDA